MHKPVPRSGPLRRVPQQHSSAASLSCRRSGGYPESAATQDPPSREFPSLPLLPCSQLEKLHNCVYVVALGKITEKIVFSAFHSNSLQRPSAVPRDSR